MSTSYDGTYYTPTPRILIIRREKSETFFTIMETPNRMEFQCARRVLDNTTSIILYRSVLDYTTSIILYCNYSSALTRNKKSFVWLEDRHQNRFYTAMTK